MAILPSARHVFKPRRSHSELEFRARTVQAAFRRHRQSMKVAHVLQTLIEEKLMYSKPEANMEIFESVKGVDEGDSLRLDQKLRIANYSPTERSEILRMALKRVEDRLDERAVDEYNRSKASAKVQFVPRHSQSTLHHYARLIQHFGYHRKYGKYAQAFSRSEAQVLLEEGKQMYQRVGQGGGTSASVIGSRATEGEGGEAAQPDPQRDPEPTGHKYTESSVRRPKETEGPARALRATPEAQLEVVQAGLEKAEDNLEEEARQAAYYAERRAAASKRYKAVPLVICPFKSSSPPQDPHAPPLTSPAATHTPSVPGPAIDCLSVYANSFVRAWLLPRAAAHRTAAYLCTWSVRSGVDARTHRTHACRRRRRYRRRPSSP